MGGNLDELVSLGCQVSNSKEVGVFIDENPTCIEYLKNLKNELPKYFPNSRLTLSHYRDHEDETWETLRVIVDTQKSVDDVFECMEKFDDEYWLERPNDALKLIVVDVGFLPKTSTIGGYEPKTELGRQLAYLREKYRARGGSFLNEAELERELERRKRE
jgi:hypothetical protein